MRTSGGSMGPRGGALLLVTAVAGCLLAVHGWSTRQSVLPAGALGSAGSSASGGASTSRSPTGSSTPPTGGGSAGQAAGAGPRLSSQSFASYSYLVWPGTPSVAATNAMTGLSITVHRTGSGISVTAGVNGQPAGAAHAYPGGARVYVVEASLGDESGTSDFNLGDDGVVVTDAHGRIVQ